MINNYFDFVKGMRKRAIDSARRNLQESRERQEGWANGFYRGLMLAFEHESRHWRTLQKDIEAQQKGDYFTPLSDHERVMRIRNLILGGGKNG